MFFTRKLASIVLALTLTLLCTVLYLNQTSIIHPTKQITKQPSNRISEEQAIAIAVNNVWQISDGYELKNPRHLAHFGAEGITISPRKNKLSWHWQLSHVGSQKEKLKEIQHGAITPHRDRQIIRYNRLGLIEQYIMKKGCIEQQFILPDYIKELSGNLVITGKVICEGLFTELDTSKALETYRWVWKNSDGMITLGDVTVKDAVGIQLPATMQVNASETRIEIPETSLVQATYPVTIDPEIGANDFRISDMGPSVDESFNAFLSDVAYNSTANQYLVVWYGDDGISSPGKKYEIYGQLLDTNGTEIGSNDFRISDTADEEYKSRWPAVAYNSTTNQYLIVWCRYAENDYEIFGQLISADGTEIGSDDFSISDNAGFGRPSVVYNSIFNQYLVVWSGKVGFSDGIFGQLFNADGSETGSNDFLISDHFNPHGMDVAFNSTNNQFLVVWSGDPSLVRDIFGQLLNAAGSQIGDDFRISEMEYDGGGRLPQSPNVAYNSTANQYLVVWASKYGVSPPIERCEIFGQLLNANGGETGSNDFRISDMGLDGDTRFEAIAPDVAYNSTANQYLVTWRGDDDTAPLVDDEYEVFGQLINADGSEIGSNDFRISDMGPDGDENFDASSSAVAYNVTTNQYLVVWYGDDDTVPLVEGENEIFGQIINASGSETGWNDFRISDMGPDANDKFDAWDPDVAYNSTTNQYLVVWEGDDHIYPLVDRESEIFGQLVNADGTESGSNDFRISDMGPDGNEDFGAVDPAVAYNSTANQYLVVWWGDDDRAPLVDEELEIFGQLLEADGSESGRNDFRISDMGPNGDTRFAAYSPDVAYNSSENQYLVVWYGDDGTFPLVDGEFEIFSQILNARGFEIGNDFKISDMGPDGNSDFGAFDPAVVYNSTEDQYLVVWSGDDDIAPLEDNELEIFGQLLNANGVETGWNDIRISDMGPDGNEWSDATNPAIAYNSTANQYLVVWSGNDGPTAPQADGEFEIFGQLLNADGRRSGSNDFRISDMGPDGNTRFDAVDPAVTYNNISNQYLVVWYGDDNTFPLVDNEREIFGQLLNADGSERKSNDFRISDMGPDGDVDFEARMPAVAHNNFDNQYLVVWHGDDDIAPLVDNDLEIFGQRLEGKIQIDPLVFHVERSTGSVYAEGVFMPDGADLAERINVSESVESGDIVELDPERPLFYRKARSNSGSVAGIITTAPGFVLGNKADLIKYPKQGLDGDNESRPIIALMGRVPVKATTENGPIRSGDLLTVSSKPGYAMKCTEAKECERTVIGKSLEALECGEGKILVFVMSR